MLKGRCPIHNTEVELEEGTCGMLSASCGCWHGIDRTVSSLSIRWQEARIAVPAGRKDDLGKLRMDLIPFGPLKDVAAVLTFGAEKYSDNNWQLVPDAVKRYESAMLRHFTAYKEGEENDPESGLPHLAHVTCCLMFLQWFTRKER